MSYQPKMSPNKILIIEDDQRMTALLSEYLTLDGFAVTCIHRANDFYDQMLQNHGLILLDLMLGEDSGFELLKHIRSLSSIPVIVMSAKSEDADKLLGFRLGADDYLAKPYNHLELVARIHAVLRRVNPTTEKKQLNNLIFDAARQQVLIGQQSVNLTGLEYRILLQLKQRCGEVVARNDIYRQSMQQNHEFESRALDVHISNIRRKIGPYKGQEQIKTLRGSGYMLLDLSETA